MIIKTKEHVQELLKEVRLSQVVGVDTETISLDDKTLVAFSIATESGYYVIPVAMKHIDNVPKSQWLQLLESASTKMGSVFHNYSFDGQVIYPHMPKILNHIPQDTLIMSHLVDENMKHGLKELVKKYFHHEMLTYKEVCGTGKNAIAFSDLIDEEIIDRYAGEDAYYAQQLYFLFTKYMIKNRGLWDCYQQIERPLLRVVLNMHLVGVPIDIDRVKSVETVVVNNVYKYQKLINKTMKDININSPKQLKQFFIVQQQLPILKQTPAGEPSMDKEILTRYAEEYNCAEADYILKYRKYNKILTTFIPAMKSEISNRIYPTFRQVGTTSGRFSCANPNFQNIPKNKEDELDLRACVKAPVGKVFIGADYSQMELRLSAHYSSDKTAIKAYHDGIDMHDITMRATGLERTKAKTVNFGILYGMGAKTLAKRIDSSIDEASEFINTFFETYPGVLKFMSDIKNEALKVGYITLYGGRKRHLSSQFFYKDSYAQEGELRSIANAVIQGSGAMIIKKAMVLMYPRLQSLNANIIAQIHDELLVECPEEHADKAKEIVEECMIKPTKDMKVPFMVDSKIGKTWKEVH